MHALCVRLGRFTNNMVACTGADHAGISRRSSGVMGNPDLQLRTDSLGLTPLLAPLSPLPLFKGPPQPQHGLPSRPLPSSGGSGSGLPAMAVEVAAFDCSSSNDSVSSMTGRHDSKLIGKGQLSSQRFCNTDKLLGRSALMFTAFCVANRQASQPAQVSFVAHPQHKMTF